MLSSACLILILATLLTLSWEHESSMCKYRIPTDFTSEKETDAFGGPITNSGELNFFGNHFYSIHSRFDVIKLEVKTTSFFSLYTRSMAKPVLVHRIETGKGSQLTPIFAERLSSFEVFSSFVLNPVVDGSSYSLTLEYDTDANSESECSPLLLQALLEPSSSFEHGHKCHPNRDGLVSKNLVAGDDGLILFSQSGEITREHYSRMEHGETVDFFFTPLADSVLDISFSFNAIASFFDIKLYQKNGANWQEIHGSESSQDLGELTFSRRMQASCAANEAFRLEVSSKTSSSPFTHNLPEDCCVPFSLSFQLVPSSHSPFIESVIPSNGYLLSPNNILQITLKTSEQLADYNDLLLSVLLESKESCQKQTSVMPVSVEKGNLNYYRLTFSKGFFGGCEYELKLLKEKLMTNTGSYVELLSEHTYGFFDSSCHAHGSLIKPYRCTCDKGYSGKDCSICSPGYALHDGTNCVPIVKCSPESCGCKSHDQFGECVPLGACTVSDYGTTECSCPQNVVGEFCESCADGFYNYPECVLCLNQGSYNQVTRQCECKKNFSGGHCEQCAPGYKGETCEFIRDKLSFSGIFIIVGVSFGIVLFVLCGIFLSWIIFIRRRPLPYRLLGSVNSSEYSELSDVECESLVH